MKVAAFLRDHLRSYRNILVHPTQEMRPPDGAAFRGGPEWPRFSLQIYARHCWHSIARPIDARPLAARQEWPYFDPRYLPLFWPQIYADRQLSPDDPAALPLLAASHTPLTDNTPDVLDAGIWCGPIVLHFGETVANHGMRIAPSSLIDATTPLVFSMPPIRQLEPPSYFWEILEHLSIDKRRVLLIRKPTRFRLLHVLPQAERLYCKLFWAGGPSRRHLRMMDAIVAAQGPVERDLDRVFVSRARLAEGHFAGESYLDEAMTAAGVTVLHPETVDVHSQMRTYRRARCLIFSEGSAVHALQLLGHLDADLIVLARRPQYRLSPNSLRPRVRSLRYVQAVHRLIHGLSPSGRPILRAGITILDEQRLLTGLKSAGIDLTPVWDSRAYAAHRDSDIAAWLAQRRAAGSHPAEQAMLAEQLRSPLLLAQTG